ncbi:MAG: hypothetical protein HYU63_04140 [Armatimonadetes bacterium]|nr:hypothetical protein [Armatimonadota bacterium]
MTLIELLSSMIILTIFANALFWILVSAKKNWQESETRLTNLQNLQIASWKMALDLRDSRIATLTDNTGGSPAAFSFLSAYNISGSFITDGDGNPTWQKYIIYYIPSGTTKLLRKEVYGSFTSALTISALIAYCDGQGSIISAFMTSLLITPDLSSKSVALSLSAQNTNNQGKIDQQTLNTTIYMRN